MNNEEQYAGMYSAGCGAVAVCSPVNDKSQVIHTSQTENASVAQSVEHLPSKQNVASSSLVACSTNVKTRKREASGPYESPRQQLDNSIGHRQLQKMAVRADVNIPLQLRSVTRKIISACLKKSKFVSSIISPSSQGPEIINEATPSPTNKFHLCG